MTELSNTNLHPRPQSRQIPQGFTQRPKHSPGTCTGLCWDCQALQAAINQESNTHTGQPGNPTMVGVVEVTFPASDEPSL